MLLKKAATKNALNLDAYPGAAVVTSWMFDVIIYGLHRKASLQAYPLHQGVTRGCDSFAYDAWPLAGGFLRQILTFIVNIYFHRLL